MDIQVASNFERYLYHRIGRDPAALGELMSQFDRTGSLSVPPGADGRVDPAFEAGAATRDEIIAAIGQCYTDNDYVIDPHTACGMTVAHALTPVTAGGTSEQGEPTLCIATAHPAKFPDAIAEATGADIARHPHIDHLADLPTRCDTLPNDADAVRQYIINKLK